MTPFTNILVPIDDGAPADAALRVAAHLARAASGRLLVAHFLPPVYTMAEFPILPVETAWIDEDRQQVEAHVRERLEADGEGPAFRVEVGVDAPFPGVPAACRRAQGST